MIRDAPGRGRGTFATALIRAGEVVTIWGGLVLPAAEARNGKLKRGTATAIAEDLVIGSPADAPGGPSAAHYLNHSCDPNLWMLDEVTLAACRDIAAGEELTADYAMWEADETFVAAWRCTCASPLCRGTVTGTDWRRRGLQERYKNHFSPFMEARISVLHE